MNIVSAEAAVSLIPPGSRVVASPGCGAPTTLLRALADRSSETPGLHLFSGLQMDYSPFVDAVRDGRLSYSTWHVMGEMRDLVHGGRAHYVPARASEVPALLDVWDCTVALVRVSPPDRDGYHSLGPTASYPVDAVDSRTIVVAEVDEGVPFTRGNRFHGSRINAFAESGSAIPEYTAAAESDVSRRIADHVMSRVRAGSTIQIGIGSIPEAILVALRDSGLDDLRFAGMGCDLMVEMYERGQLRSVGQDGEAPIVAVELMGTRALMDFADDSPVVTMTSSRAGHNATVLSRHERFTSINSAIEVDLWGQVNAETVSSRQVSGVGGSVDFTESAFQSDGGQRIIVLPSTVKNGANSCIVPRLPAGSAVTIPRSLAHLVVTEFGVADLRGASLAERSERLINVAHPDHRDRLARELESIQVSPQQGGTQ